MKHSEIIENAKRLKEVENSLNADILADKPTENLIDQYKEYLDLKKLIRLSLLDASGLAFDEDLYEENEEFIKIIHNISFGKKREIESKFKNKLLVRFIESKKNPEKNYHSLEEFSNDLSLEELEELDFLRMTDELTFEEEEKLVEELFNDWFSGYVYVRGLYNVGILIARIGSLPPLLDEFLGEMRECFAFQKYLAVCALSRTILEISVRDLYNLAGFNDPKTPEHAIVESYFYQNKKGQKWKYIDEYNVSLDDMRNLLCKLPEYEDFHQEIGDLKEEMNRVIHGNKTSNRNEAEVILKKTLALIHNLYEV